jgi:DNA-binding NtrC family response regulator
LLSPQDHTSWDVTYLATVEEAANAGRRLRAAVDEILAQCESAMEELLGGTTAAARARSALESADPRRLELHSAMDSMSQALRRCRSEAIRILVDTEQMTISEVARFLDISVSMTSRLYHASAGP